MEFLETIYKGQSENWIVIYFEQNIYLNIYTTYMYVHTGYFRRNLQHIGRMFLRILYTDKTKHTYILSWVVMVLIKPENGDVLAVPHTLPVQHDVLYVCCAGLYLR